MFYNKLSSKIICTCPYGRLFYRNYCYKEAEIMKKEFVMKKTIKLIGIIVLAVVIGFSIAACGGSGNGDGDSGNSKSVEATVGASGSIKITYSGDQDMTVTVTTNLPAPNNSFTMTKVGDEKIIEGLTSGQKVNVKIAVSGTISKLEVNEDAVGTLVWFQVYKGP
jgi:hypothetical protein